MTIVKQTVSRIQSSRHETAKLYLIVVYFTSKSVDTTIQGFLEFCVAIAFILYYCD